MSDYGRMNGLGRFSLFPPVLKTLIILNLAIYILQHWLIGPFSFGGVTISSYIVKYLGLIPWNTSDVISFGFGSSGSVFYPWQLLTYQFLHGDFWHVFFNLLALWMFGAELENMWGSAKFLAFYILSGIGAGIIQLIFLAIIGSTTPTVGASGAVFGILLAFAMTFPNRPIYMFPFFIPIPAKFFVMIFAVIELVSGVSGNDGMAHFAHLGGALVGFLLLKYGDYLGIFSFAEKMYSSATKPKNNYNNFERDFHNARDNKEAKVFKMDWKTSQRQSEAPKRDFTDEYNARRFEIDGEIITQQKIDIILDKISESGYQNLTSKEKYILTELSKKL